jgi:hypothetical protein
MSEMWSIRPPTWMGVIDMNDVFPSVSTVSVKDAEAGSIISVPRAGGSVLALLTDHLTDGVRSFVWLNAKFQDRPPVIFAEKWRNEESALCYNGNIRFELGTAEDEIDARGNRFRETSGVIVSVGDDLFIRAAPQDDFYDTYRLINIRTGSIFPDSPPSNVWSFLSWRLWVRDSVADRDLMLTEFRVKKIARRAD